MAIKYATQSRCECQATLGVELDEACLVLHGWAERHGNRENAPASSVGSGGDRFDLSWHCPMCGRNTLRTVYRDALKAVHPESTNNVDDAPKPQALTEA